MIKENEITTAVVLDTRRKKLKTGTYPVKLRVTHLREQKYYSLKWDLTPDEFEKVNAPKPRGTYKDAKLEFALKEEKAQKIIESLPEFSFEKFAAQFSQKPRSLKNVYYYFDQKINELEKTGRMGTHRVYKDSMNSLKKFFKNDEYLDFKNVTPTTLQKYEKWMLDTGKSVTTIGMYLRNLRALINNAIVDGVISVNNYPFGKGKYQIPTKRGTKKALTLETIEKIYNYKPKEFSLQDKAKDLWIFSYLCNGANIKDIARLKYKNIQEDSIIFERAKTSNSIRDHRDIVVVLTDEIKNIIEKWGNKPVLPESYVFPILEEEITPKQEYNRIKRIVRKINSNMQDIAGELEIDKNITTYTARHSFSTVLKRSGASIEFISESLGHSDLRTTENYLDSFENDVKKEFAAKLTAFKK